MEIKACSGMVAVDMCAVEIRYSLTEKVKEYCIYVYSVKHTINPSTILHEPFTVQQTISINTQPLCYNHAQIMPRPYFLSVLKVAEICGGL